METVDEEFTRRARWTSSRSSTRREQAVLRLVELDPHAHLHAPEAGVGGQDRPRRLRRRHGRARRAGRPAAEEARRLGIADNTIVIYTTDNGAEVMSWPDGGTTPFRGEKAPTGRAASACPCMIRWPGMIKPGTIFNDIVRARGLAPDVPGRGRRAGRQGEAARRATRPATRPSRSTSTATTCCRSSRAR